MSTTMSSPEQFWTRLFQLTRISLLLGFAYLIYKAIVRIIFTYRVRNLYHEFPSLPRHRLWGNLENVGPRLHPSINRHPDYAFEELWNELGRPPAFVIDFAPVDRAMLVISDPGMAEFITQPSDEHRYSLPKTNSLEAMTTLIGNHSLLITEGEEWRTLRRRFNKGFSSAHLHTLIPLIVSKARIYLDRLRAYARKGQDFALKDLASDLTTDVITEIAIEKDFHAQTVPDGEGAKSTFGILTSIRIMSTLIEKVGQGFDPAGYFSIQRRVKEWLYDKLYTRAIYNEIVKKLPNMSGEKSAASSATKAIVHLALSGVDPTQAVLDSTVSQVKTFLFAGQDTTSTLTQWMAWELSKSYPASPLYSERSRQIREKLCAEHDAVFGSVNPFAPLDILSNPHANIDEILGAKLPYTTAFIKETLRLYPPAASARIVPLAPYDPNIASDKKPGPFFIDVPAWTNSRTGERHPETRIRADGMRLYNSHFLIQRNPKIWGPDAHEFEPARFLDRSGKGSVDELEEALKVGGKSSAVNFETPSSKANLPHPYHISTLPAGSFRAFERGPRTCIGSNLAYVEAKIVLAIMARGFEWTKVGLDGRRPRSGEVVYGGTGKEDMEVGEKRGWKVWNINNVTSVPVDGMRMRVRLRQ